MISCVTSVRHVPDNKMDLDQFATFKLHRFIPTQREHLVKIHLFACTGILINLCTNFVYFTICKIGAYRSEQVAVANRCSR